MQNFIFELSDGKKITQNISAEDKTEAMSIALTALSTYSSSKFPPPEHIEITVSDADFRRVATLPPTSSRLIPKVDAAGQARNSVEATSSIP